MSVDISASIETVPAGYYRFNVDAEALDLLRFRQETARSQQAAAEDDLATARDALAKALALWRGPPLCEIESECLHSGVLVGLTEEYLLTVERRQALDLLLGRAEEIISELQILVQDNPARERFWYHLVLALYRADRSGEALEVYRDAITYLREEFGVDPSAELRALHLAIVQRDPDLLDTSQDARWLAAAGWTTREPGRVALRS